MESLLPDAAGNVPTSISPEVMAQEAVAARDSMSPREHEARFLQVGLNRGGRFIDAYFTIDRQGIVHWTYDAKRTFVMCVGSGAAPS